MTWDWLAAIVFLALFVLGPLVPARVIGLIPRYAELRDQNERADREKREKDAYRVAVERGTRTSAITNFGLALLLVPFFVSLDARPLWQYAVEILAVLLVYDFLYYWLHRSLFHGTLLRKEHALHHLARRPTSGDSVYIHPWESFLGILVFMGAIPIVSLVTGGPLSAISAGLAAVAWAQLTQLNHAWTNLSSTRWLDRWVEHVTSVHRAHHVDMNRGNYASLTTVYDRLFGTFEEPVKRETI